MAPLCLPHVRAFYVMTRTKLIRMIHIQVILAWFGCGIIICLYLQASKALVVPFNTSSDMAAITSACLAINRARSTANALVVPFIAKQKIDILII